MGVAEQLSDITPEITGKLPTATMGYSTSEITGKDMGYVTPEIPGKPRGSVASSSWADVEGEDAMEVDKGAHSAAAVVASDDSGSNSRIPV